MDDKIKRMKELIPLLSEAAKAYYQESREIMSNFEYDRATISSSWSLINWHTRSFRYCQLFKLSCGLS